MTFRLFIIQLIILTAGAAVMIAIANYFIPPFQDLQSVTWFSLGFFFLLTVITGYIGFRSIEKTAYGFVSNVNGMVMLKLLFCVAFVIAYLLIAKPGKPFFVIPFFILYVIFTAFEIRQLVMAQKKQAQQQKLSKNANG